MIHSSVSFINEEFEMKKRPVVKAFICIISAFLIVKWILPVGLIYLITWIAAQPNPKIDGRPTDQLFAAIPAPDQKHIACYYISGGNTTVSDSATIIIKAQDDGNKWKNKDQWCIFWGYHISEELMIKWIDCQTLQLIYPPKNKTIELMIYADEYDYDPYDSENQGMNPRTPVTTSPVTTLTN